MTQTVSNTQRQRRTAMILSGGGARGAYEVGVLWYIFDDLSRMRGGPPRIDVLCGTSVGAINACYLTAHLGDPVLGMRRLVHLWSELQLTRVLGFGAKQLGGLPRLLLGGGDVGTGVFDVKPMADLVQREISWRALARALRKRQLRALTVSTTEVSTGRTVVFMQTAPDVDIPQTAPPRTLFRADHIGPHHALASAAIPMLFPPVKIDDELYLDGGLRQNTPIAPALRLGATHVFAIGSSREVQGIVTKEGPVHPPARAPGAAFLLGKVLNAFLLDHVDVDLELLNRLNNVIRDGTKAYGPGFLDAITREASKRNAPPYRYVEAFTIRPSEDLGKLASDHVRKGKFIGNPFFTKRLFDLVDIGVGDEADLASYLLFDGHFCRQLIEMGRADAHARRDEILAFFGDAADDGGGAHEDDSGTWEKANSLTLPIGT
ncbi:Patatin [Labilithrix luteola]|uniref:Patatin n=1 Tax=Labilithrix luteola TaxID=1391654 RepID=A0A0K1PTN6_9BACT|nr:patatin-like phospholipase family protein [Labilithrix luteola]AKU96721.1 Patatin [Labilithrix luteola]